MDMLTCLARVLVGSDLIDLNHTNINNNLLACQSQISSTLILIVTACSELCRARCDDIRCASLTFTLTTLDSLSAGAAN